MKIRNIVGCALAVVMTLGLTACGAGGGKAPVVEFDPVAGETINAGNVSATCPEGWYNMPVRDYFSDVEDALDPGSLKFQKDTDDEWSYGPAIIVSFFGTDHEMMSYDTLKGFYDEAVDVEAFTVGDDVWHGIQYNIGDDILEATISVKGNGAVEVLLVLEGEGRSISLTDPDVLTVLSSIKY